jgi:hypothetical protein
MVDRLESITEDLLTAISSLKENIDLYMYSEVNTPEEGEVSQYITTSGNMGFAWKQGEESIEVMTGSEQPEGEEGEESDEEQ